MHLNVSLSSAFPCRFFICTDMLVLLYALTIDMLVLLYALTLILLYYALTYYTFYMCTVKFHP